MSFAFGENGLIKRAEDAGKYYANDTAYTEGSIVNVESYINDILNGTGGNQETIVKLSDVKGGEAFDKKTTVEDEVGNKIVVPAGFRISSESGDTVQQGIVIEDVSASTDTNVQGSQYVWIPVGEFKKDGGELSREIILGRYTFANDAQGTPTLQQAAYTDDNPENYKSEKVIESCFIELAEYKVGTSSDGTDRMNSTAYELEKWIKSVKDNGGYYIGRYEASFASGTSIENYKAASKITKRFSEDSMSYSQGTLWNFITQVDASKVSINTYADSSSVKSDLMNSYAWDTAIVFIQEANNNNYSNQISKNESLSNTGNLADGVKDEVCKINDMASNIYEWTTEYSNYVSSTRAYSWTGRGGYYGDRSSYTTVRHDYYPVNSMNDTGFRLTIYM